MRAWSSMKEIRASAPGILRQAQDRLGAGEGGGFNSL
jgi:hypothetical protein